MVNVFFEDTEILDVSPEFFGLWLEDLCLSHGWSLGDVSLVFCSDEYLLEMNRRHLNHDYYTDIITFDYTNEDVSGDLFISVDRVSDNAKDVGVPFVVELNRVVAHGVLHLLGFKDKTEDESAQMRKEEDKALKLIVSRET